ncbi:NAD(P)-dependent glycerol-3-phosphate dehydrogenase [Loktanella sp. IMCC34160]|uniref:NAD(P)H-dependent glycerol-3-phosphate dehydrogenase n=1 Tax=Loktanella sp. IMCC34160 TaxID=2510646 RepID=UPI00101E2063|nr:NAD(P)H-dependent glycerol-3-phosphate dehydrogenase [Loktanella sp. IMCC34160]RYG91295.1 NAD(P)-dependent glycerol-3-phosphate dehydrogenase [Loktanella sp. IMCC34160]
MKIGIAGAGAFGTALAITIGLDGRQVMLWARDPKAVQSMRDTRQSPRLPDVPLPDDVRPTDSLDQLAECDVILLAMPAQAIRGFLADHATGFAGKRLVACCKGIDIETMRGPSQSIEDLVPDAIVATLTGPSFAADIARGLPTALTLACKDETEGAYLQSALSTATLRLYRTTDVTGSELGGALKNVMAIACGACIGAGLGESARAALLTRGFAEMQRLALSNGARPETLMGLSGLGDLALTCTSDLSRNYQFGLSIGRGEEFDPAVTVEGAKTAIAVTKLAKRDGLELPISFVVADLVARNITVEEALRRLLSRPLKEE